MSKRALYIRVALWVAVSVETQEAWRAIRVSTWAFLTALASDTIEPSGAVSVLFAIRERDTNATGNAMVSWWARLAVTGREAMSLVANESRFAVGFLRTESRVARIANLSAGTEDAFVSLWAPVWRAEVEGIAITLHACESWWTLVVVSSGTRFQAKAVNAIVSWWTFLIDIIVSEIRTLKYLTLAVVAEGTLRALAIATTTRHTEGVTIR